MADRTTTRLNLRYHWKAGLLWGLLLVGLLAGVLLGRADAWVRGVQVFPEGEVTVVLERFCRSTFSAGCDGHGTPQRWHNLIQAALTQWNEAGANFTFHTRPARPGDDPCNMGDAVPVILATEDNLCPSDGRFPIGKAGAAALDSGRKRARVYVNANSFDSLQSSKLRRILLHEFGHVVGLGHPDAHGQHVQAIMNREQSHDTLQPDDIAGIRALYGARVVERPANTAGFLGSPAHNTAVSGIGFISGWKCHAQDITVRIDDGPPLDMSMGGLREDTRSACDGEAHNGFIMQVNWNSIGAGRHVAVAYDNGIEFDRNTFMVGTTGEEFLRGVTADIEVPDFPRPGETGRFVWNQSTQHLELREVYPAVPTRSTGDLSAFEFLLHNGDGDGNRWHVRLEEAETEASLAYGSMTFFGFRTTTRGSEILLGRFDSAYGGPDINFEVGHPLDVLPRLPSFHRYRYAWVFPLATDPETGQATSESTPNAHRFCYVLVFNNFVRARHGEVDKLPVTVTLTARENGVCVPEDGVEHLLPLSLGYFDAYTD